MEYIVTLIEALQASFAPIAYFALGIGITLAIIFEAKTLIKKLIHQISSRQ